MAVPSSSTCIDDEANRPGQACDKEDEANEVTPGPAPPSRDWSKDAASVFNNIRTPAALLTGSSYTGINSAPIPNEKDSFRLGTAKRLYLILSVLAFTNNLLSVLISTLALEQLTGTYVMSSASSVHDFFVQGDFESFYVAVQTHFYLGALCISMVAGLKVYINYSCSRFASIAIKFVAAGFFMMISMLPDDVMVCPVRYARILVDQARSGVAPNVTIAIVFGLSALSQTLWEAWSISRLSKMVDYHTLRALRTDC